MPLSEHEQRMLDEMERNLYGGDADVHTSRDERLKPNYRMVTLGAIVAVAGVAIMVGGVMAQMIIVGVAGFVVSFVGVLIAGRPSREPVGAARSAGRRPSFMQRMEQQWEDRRNEPG